MLWHHNKTKGIWPKICDQRLKIKERMMEQLLQQKSILISSLNSDGHPEISYAPFVKYQDKIYLSN